MASARRAPPSPEAEVEMGNGRVQSPAGAVATGGPSNPESDPAASSSAPRLSPRSVGTTASREGAFVAPVSWNIASRLTPRHVTNAASARPPVSRKWSVGAPTRPTSLESAFAPPSSAAGSSRSRDRIPSSPSRRNGPNDRAAASAGSHVSTVSLGAFAAAATKSTSDFNSPASPSATPSSPSATPSSPSFPASSSPSFASSSCAASSPSPSPLLFASSPFVVVSSSFETINASTGGLAIAYTASAPPPHVTASAVPSGENRAVATRVPRVPRVPSPSFVSSERRVTGASPAATTGVDDRSDGIFPSIGSTTTTTTSPPTPATATR